MISEHIKTNLTEKGFVTFYSEKYKCKVCAIDDRRARISFDKLQRTISYFNNGEIYPTKLKVDGIIFIKLSSIDYIKGDDLSWKLMMKQALVDLEQNGYASTGKTTPEDYYKMSLLLNGLNATLVAKGH